MIGNLSVNGCLILLVSNDHERTSYLLKMPCSEALGFHSTHQIPMIRWISAFSISKMPLAEHPSLVNSSVSISAVCNLPLCNCPYSISTKIISADLEGVHSIIIICQLQRCCQYLEFIIGAPFTATIDSNFPIAKVVH